MRHSASQRRFVIHTHYSLFGDIYSPCIDIFQNHHKHRMPNFYDGNFLFRGLPHPRSEHRLNYSVSPILDIFLFSKTAYLEMGATGTKNTLKKKENMMNSECHKIKNGYIYLVCIHLVIFHQENYIGKTKKDNYDRKN